MLVTTVVCHEGSVADTDVCHGSQHFGSHITVE